MGPREMNSKMVVVVAGPALINSNGNDLGASDWQVILVHRNFCIFPRLAARIPGMWEVLVNKTSGQKRK